MEAVRGLPPSVDGVDMMPQRRQPYGALPCCLAYPVPRTGPGCPARRPDPGVLARVALGQFPARHDLRRCCLGLMVLQRAWLPVFGRFTGPLALSDSLRLCVPVVSVRCTMRALRRWARPDAGPPESRTRCCRACQGSSPPPGACTPCPRGVPAVAVRVFGARRHPDWPLRGSIPCRHLPLAPLHGPRYRGSRMTRGQCGWLDLHCRRLALLHIVPVCLGTPQRRASAAAGSRSAAEAVGSQLSG
jgi:hypothetical protein